MQCGFKFFYVDEARDMICDNTVCINHVSGRKCEYSIGGGDCIAAKEDWIGYSQSIGIVRAMISVSPRVQGYPKNCDAACLPFTVHLS